MTLSDLTLPAGQYQPPAGARPASELIQPDAVIGSYGTDTGTVPAEPCQVCGAHPFDGPEGAFDAERGVGWRHDWHCWRCGYRPGQTESTITLLARQASADTAALSQARDEIMSRLIQAMAKQQAAQQVTAGPASDEVAQLRAEVAALRDHVNADRSPATTATENADVLALREEIARLRGEADQATHDAGPGPAVG